MITSSCTNRANQRSLTHEIFSNHKHTHTHTRSERTSEASQVGEVGYLETKKETQKSSSPLTPIRDIIVAEKVWGLCQTEGKK